MVLGSVADKALMGQVFRKFEVNVVYHAAAYKHVPLVKANPFGGLYNNTFGTKAAAIAAAENNVERFILISTDKAVRPTNIMGASKRLAELVLQDLAQQKGQNTFFSMVRFGNVLGSSGSVVVLFEKQIERGGAITVTHLEVSRFFYVTFRGGFSRDSSRVDGPWRRSLLVGNGGGGSDFRFSETNDFAQRIVFKV